MTRNLAPFWVVDVVGLVVVAALCAVGKVGSDTTIAIVVTVLGLGAVSRARVGVRGYEGGQNEPPQDPPDDPSAPAPVTLRPVSRRSRTPIPIGGIVSFFYALAHLRS